MSKLTPNTLTALFVASIALLSACSTDNTTEAVDSISVIELANVATMAGIHANNNCLQAATDTLNGIHQRNGVATEYSDCSRRVVKSWLEKRDY